MNSYEKIIKIIREQSNVKAYPQIRLGVMLSDKVCQIGDIELDADDYFVAEHLVNKLEEDDIVAIYKINSEKYLILEKVVEI